MSNFKVEKRPKLIGFKIVRLKIPREFILLHCNCSDLSESEIRKFLKIKDRIEREKNKLSHVANLVDKALLLNDSDIVIS
jgi:hypothetical protein